MTKGQLWRTGLGAVLILILGTAHPEALDTLKKRSVGPILDKLTPPDKIEEKLEAAGRAEAILDIKTAKEPAGPTVTIHVSGKPAVHAFTLDDGKKIVIHFNNTVNLRDGKDVRPKDTSLLRLVRTRLYKIEPEYMSRVVLDLARPCPYQLEETDGTVTVSLTAPAEAPAPTGPVASEKPARDAAPKAPLAVLATEQVTQTASKETSKTVEEKPREEAPARNSPDLVEAQVILGTLLPERDADASAPVQLAEAMDAKAPSPVQIVAAVAEPLDKEPAKPEQDGQRAKAADPNEPASESQEKEAGSPAPSPAETTPAKPVSRAEEQPLVRAAPPSPPSTQLAVPPSETAEVPAERYEVAETANAPEPWMAVPLGRTLLSELTAPESNDAVSRQDAGTQHPEAGETPALREQEPGLREQEKEKPAPIIEVRLRQPGEKPGSDAGNAKTAAEDQAQLAALEKKVDSLRADMLRLQQTLDMYSGNELADLKAENEQLRQELRQLYEINKITGTKVPAPNKALLDEVLSEAGNKQEEERTPVTENAQASAGLRAATTPEEPKAAEPAATTSDGNPAEAVKPGSMEEKVLKEVERWRSDKEAKKTAEKENKKAPSKDASKPAKKSDAREATAKANSKDAYQIVTEWGRTPEDAKAINKPEVSLKGMICVVPADTDDAHLSMIGQKLRHDFANYNNLNIDVFDDVGAAKQFEKGGSADEHHVLSISKHAASNRDVILLIRGDTKQEIPLGNGDGPKG